MKASKQQLNKKLQSLDALSSKIVETRGYTRDVEKLRLLAEMIKEQLAGENSRHPAGSSR